MHEERYELSGETAEAVRSTKAKGGRIFSVGTTTLRVLESVANERGAVIAGSGRTSIFIYPPYSFKVVDALLTNFHLPRSTLLMLVSAFASPAGTNGREAILGAYAEAIHRHYRFFSYGDAMLIV
jgi:S-adenosylmethionine:tRNA ribosyltransferase-isomerase